MTEAKLVPQEAIIPIPLPKYCTERLLVMEFLKGPKLYEGLRPYMKVLADKEGISIEDFEDRERTRINVEGIPARYDGPTSSQIQRYKKLLRWRDWFKNMKITIVNYTIAPIMGSKFRKEYVKTVDP